VRRREPHELCDERDVDRERQRPEHALGEACALFFVVGRERHENGVVKERRTAHRQRIGKRSLGMGALEPAEELFEVLPRVVAPVRLGVASSQIVGDVGRRQREQRGEVIGDRSHAGGAIVARASAGRAVAHLDAPTWSRAVTLRGAP
jgi:hypothetical protein